MNMDIITCKERILYWCSSTVVVTPTYARVGPLDELTFDAKTNHPSHHDHEEKIYFFSKNQ